MSDDFATALIKRKYLEAGVPEVMLSNAEVSATALCAGAGASSAPTNALEPLSFLDHQALFCELAQKAGK